MLFIVILLMMKMTLVMVIMFMKNILMVALVEDL